MIKYIQFVFQYPNISTTTTTAKTKTANKDASDLYAQNKAEFMLRVKENVRISRDKIYDPSPTDDTHYIVFERFDNDVHGPVLEKIKTDNLTSSLTPPASGLSWVREGEFIPLSK